MTNDQERQHPATDEGAEGKTYEEAKEEARENPGEGSGWTSETGAVDNEEERAEK